MFNCSVCANTPFGLLLGRENGNEPAVQRRISTIRRDADLSSISSSSDSGIGGGDNDDGNDDNALAASFQPRTAADIQLKLASWKVYLHPRAHELWNTDSGMHIDSILELVASHTDKKDDPVMGDDDYCVTWHGDYMADEETDVQIPAVVLRKTVAESQTRTSLLRTLTFMFVDDDSFDLIFKTADGQTPQLQTSCGNRRCINLKHVLLPD